MRLNRNINAQWLPDAAGSRYAAGTNAVKYDTPQQPEQMPGIISNDNSPILY